MDKPTVGKIVPLSNELRNVAPGGCAQPRWNPHPIQRELLGIVTAKSWVDMVREFHEKYGVPIATHPADADDETIELRHMLHDEEFNELYDAMFTHTKRFDISKVADAIADLIYVLIGTALCYGIPLDEVFTEVHRSNMTKDGSRREDGKILKGPNWEPPRIKEILDRYVAKESGTTTD